MSIEIKEHSFNTGTVTLNYAEGPASGPPLVLLHGGSARWQNSESIMPDLAADWHLYAPEFRGHGQSGRVVKHKTKQRDMLLEKYREEKA